MPTIKDVAREAGVSIATVSYVLNNKSDSISEQTRNLVLEAARRIGYTPNITARNLRYSRTGLIGYAWHTVPEGQVNPILDRFTYHLAYAAEMAGYHILTFIQPLEEPQAVYDDLSRAGRLDAFILAGIKYDDPRVNLLLERKFPFAGFGRSNPELNFPWVDVDGYGGVKKAVQYLIELGHRRIGFVGWGEDLSATFSERLKGYETALKEVGLPIPDEYIYYGEHSEQLGRDAFDYWWRLPEDQRPTAVMAVSDLEAIGLMNAAKEHGLTIGEDLSIIGFDDVPMSQYLSPPLTTLQQPIPEIAEILIDMLTAILNRRKPQYESQLVQPLLVKRGSCGAPKA